MHAAAVSCVSAGLQCSGEAVLVEGTGEPWAGELHGSRAKARGVSQRHSSLENFSSFSLELYLVVVQGKEVFP